jgi:hypothetical protein
MFCFSVVLGREHSQVAPNKTLHAHVREPVLRFSHSAVQELIEKCYALSFNGIELE